MGWSKLAVVTALLVIIMFTGMMGSYFGFTVNGSPVGGAALAESPGLLGIVDWLWTSAVFLFTMSAFMIDGMPAFISLIFLAMELVTVYVLIELVRGN